MRRTKGNNTRKKFVQKNLNEKVRKGYIPEDPVFDELDLVRSICRDSYKEFLREFWDEIVPEKAVWNWHIDVLCDELQKMAERVFAGMPRKHDLIVNLPPGMTKSTIFSVAFAPWVWTRMPTARIIGNSFSHHLSIDLSRKSRDVVECDKYRTLFPEVELREDQNTKSYFMNTYGGMRYSTSTGGSVTGMHAHFLISDDPIEPGDTASLTNADLDTANRFMNETLPSRKVDKEVVPMIIVMQRLHQNDPSGNRLERIKTSPVRHVCLPADCREYDVKPKRYKKYYRGGLLDPVRLPRSVLKQEKATLGTFGYAGQYGQSPVPRQGGMFLVDKLAVTRIVPPIREIVRYWDKAGTKDGGARTAGVKIGDAGPDYSPRFYVLDVRKFQEDSATRERLIRQTADMDGWNVQIVIEQEPGSGGMESAENTVKNLSGFRVLKDKVTGDKITRADPFSTQVNEGNVALVSADWNADFLDEMQHYPNSKYKDQIDAAAGAFNHISRKRVRIGAI